MKKIFWSILIIFMMCGLVACAKKEDVGDNLAQLTKDMEPTTAEEENVPSISEVMDRIVSEIGLDKAVPFENTITFDEQDDLILLCSTEDGRYQAYGCFSKEYGTMGIILNNRINGMDNTNYLEEAWDYSYVQPQIYEMEDGKVAFSFVTGSGTGISKEKLILFESFDTGTMKPYELKDDVIKKQMDAQIDCQVDTENKMVQIIEIMSEKDTPIAAIPYEDELEEDVTIKGAFFSMDQVKYILGQKTLISVGVALDIEEYVSPVYVGDVTLQVDYSQDDNGDLKFLLCNPGTYSSDVCSENVQNEMILKVNDTLYYGTDEIGPMGDSGSVEGEIISSIETNSIPTENGSSNFGCIGNSYTYDSGDGFIMVALDDKEWHCFYAENRE